MQLLFIVVSLYFIVCQIVVRKNWYPSFLMRKTASATTLQAMLIIALSIALAIVFHPLIWLTAMVTVLMCSIIADQYRQVFEKMERGQKI